MEEKIGEKFQQETKYTRETLPRGQLDWANKPKRYKEYPDSKKIALTSIELLQNVSLDEVLRTRKSIRNFAQKPLQLEQLSYLLWAASGIQRVEQGYEFRTAPSAGALYPIETYTVVNDVENAPQGIYHYSIRDHILEELAQGDFRAATTQVALGQNMCARAAVVFLWTAIFFRSMWKYKQRALRYIYLDMGHIGQNLALAATSLRLGTCQIGALFDDEGNQLLNIDGIEESVIYMTVCGYPR